MDDDPGDCNDYKDRRDVVSIWSHSTRCQCYTCVALFSRGYQYLYSVDAQYKDFGSVRDVYGDIRLGLTMAGA